MHRPLLTDPEIITNFGDPATAFHSGTLARWEAANLIPIALPAPLPLSWDRAHRATTVRCHARISRFLSLALRMVYDQPVLWSSLDDYGGCYEFRAQRHAKKLSRHSWGIAIDLDVADNEMGNTTPGMDPRIVKIFDSYGFAWGGDFGATRIDGMHFEFADTTRLVA